MRISFRNMSTTVAVMACSVLTPLVAPGPASSAKSLPADDCPVQCSAHPITSQSGSTPPGVQLTITFLSNSTVSGHAYVNTCATCPDQMCSVGVKLVFDAVGTPYCGRFRMTGGGWSSPLHHYERDGKLFAQCDGSQFLDSRVDLCDDDVLPAVAEFTLRATLNCNCDI